METFKLSTNNFNKVSGSGLPRGRKVAKLLIDGVSSQLSLPPEGVPEGGLKSFGFLRYWRIP